MVNHAKAKANTDDVLAEKVKTEYTSQLATHRETIVGAGQPTLYIIYSAIIPAYMYF